MNNNPLGSPPCNTKMTPRLFGAERLDTGTNEALFSKYKFGAGTAWYLSGVPDNKPGQKLFKRLVFMAAGKMDCLLQLDCTSAGGFVYYYPEGNVLIAYNNNIPSNTLKLNLGLFGDAGKVRFEGLSPSSSTFELSKAQLNSEISITVQEKTYMVWRVIK